MKKNIFLLMVFLLPLTLYAGEVTYKPKEGYVPDEATAKGIAEAVWIPVYGKELIEREKPFEAVLKEGVWTVTGTLPCPEGERCLGGVAEIDISKDDGRVLRVIHGE